MPLFTTSAELIQILPVIATAKLICITLFILRWILSFQRKCKESKIVLFKQNGLCYFHGLIMPRNLTLFYVFTCMKQNEMENLNIATRKVQVFISVGYSILEKCIGRLNQYLHLDLMSNRTTTVLLMHMNI